MHKLILAAVLATSVAFPAATFAAETAAAKAAVAAKAEPAKTDKKSEKPAKEAKPHKLADGKGWIKVEKGKVSISTDEGKTWADAKAGEYKFEVTKKPKDASAKTDAKAADAKPRIRTIKVDEKGMLIKKAKGDKKGKKDKSAKKGH